MGGRSSKDANSNSSNDTAMMVPFDVRFKRMVQSMDVTAWSAFPVPIIDIITAYCHTPTIIIIGMPLTHPHSVLMNPFLIIMLHLSRRTR